MSTGTKRTSAKARCRCSCGSLECRAWMLAVRPERRISMSTNVATAISMNTANENRNALSTVNTAAASTIRKARMARVT